jgi:hypothetical protein
MRISMMLAAFAAGVCTLPWVTGCAIVVHKPGATAQDAVEAKYECDRDIAQSHVTGLATRPLWRECMNAKGWY